MKNNSLLAGKITQANRRRSNGPTYAKAGDYAFNAVNLANAIDYLTDFSEFGAFEQPDYISNVRYVDSARRPHAE